MSKAANGTGTCKLGKDGYWRWQVMDGYKSDGSPNRRGGTAKTQREAEQKLFTYRQQVKTETVTPKSRENQTVREYCLEWLEGKSNISEQTRRKYEQDLRCHVYSDSIGNIKLVKLTAADIRSLYGRLRKKNVGGQGHGPNVTGTMKEVTLKHIHSVFKSAVTQAVEDGFIVKSPFPRSIRVIADSDQRGRVLYIPSAEEMKRFVSAAIEAKDSYLPLWKMLMITGARIGEMLALKWSDVSFDKQTLIIDQTLISSTGGIAVFGPTKTREARTIAIGDATVSILKEHQQRQIVQREKAGSEYASYDLVLSNQVGKPFHHRNVMRAFKLAAERSGLPGNLRIHDLRHFAATEMMRSIPLKVAAARLGHKGLAMHQHYQHSSLVEDTKAAVFLEGVIL